MSSIGEGAALATAKVAAGFFGIALHLSSVHRAVAVLAAFYLAVAVLPWVAILFYLASCPFSGLSLRRDNLGEQNLKDGGARHCEDRADDAQQLSADEQRDDDRHRTDANLPFHHLGHEHVIFELLLQMKKTTTNRTLLSETVEPRRRWPESRKAPGRPPESARRRLR